MDDLGPRLQQLAADLDRLEEAAAPLLFKGNQAAAALRLPLLDRAKLQVLAAYALESTLFGSLGLAGVDARSHAVFRELQRVRQYMQKIDAAERKAAGTDKDDAGPASRLDKAAAIRFVKAEMDSPAVRAQLGQLEKKETHKARDAAAAAAASTSTASATKSSGSRGRKRGGAAAHSDRRDGSSNLAKRPKAGSRPK